MSGTAGRLVVAYHGCDASLRDALLDGSAELKASRNPYDWLGKGIYFFEEDWPRALHFATESAAKPELKLSARPIVAPAVVGAILRIETWLDLSTQEGIDEFVVAYNGLAVTLAAKGASMPVNKAAEPDDTEMILHNLDRAVIEFLHEARATQKPAKGEAPLPPYQAVRGPFTQGEPVVATSAIRRHTHMQLALRDIRCVVGYFRVRDAE